ncbi:winged helix-turn-helix domain-containing protein [Bradyrhizobium sp. DN5]|uniref:winged helix-turn-helix domain-containing protein n=1 Tax=Bradyrhizobium sp. DN5 TaxID=3056950 RepID=UPI0035262C86
MRLYFEKCVLDTDRRELRRGESPVPVQPQVFDLLVHLIENRDRVVTKDDLLEAVWNGRIVSESTLISRINAARRAIGDDGDQQRLIRTIARKGVRFVGEVEKRQAVASSSLPIEGAPEPSAATMALVDRPSIAVLPFTNMSGDTEHDFFVDGITEDLITALSRIRQFLVIARNATLRYKRELPDIREITAMLGVRYVVEGSVRRDAGRVRVSAQLLDGGTGNHVWAERFDRKLDDIFAIQDEIAREIAGQIEPELGRAEYERTKATPPENLGAWELFHRGMALIAQRTRDGNAEARRVLERSLALDSGFAPAHAAIAWSQAEDLFFCYAAHDPKDILDRARRAVVLDDRDALSHLALAWGLTFDRQPESAVNAAKRAIALNPSFAHAYAILGRLLIQSGRCDEGIRQAEWALRLSPFAPSARQYLNVLAVGYLYLGNDAKAVEFARESIHSFDTWAQHMIITSALGHLGDHEGAKHEIRETRKHRPDFSITQVLRDYVVFDATCLDRLLAGLRKAGVAETSKLGLTSRRS